MERENKWSSINSEIRLLGQLFKTTVKIPESRLLVVLLLTFLKFVQNEITQVGITLFCS